MAKKLIDQEETARLLGVSVDELNSMRDRKQIFPKRDSGAWKYDQDEIDRVLQERQDGSGTGGSGGTSWGDSLSLDDLTLELNDPDAMVLNEGPHDPLQSESTIIGRSKSVHPSQSDIQLGGSHIVSLTNDPGRSGMSDVRLAPDSAILGRTPPPLSNATPGNSGLLDDLVLEPLGGSGKGGSGSFLGSGSLKLSDDELQLSETASDKARRGGGEYDTKKGGSKIELSIDDDDLVLGGSGSDITLGGDSGISLIDPHDSGLSLEEPLELEGSGIDSLELGEDDVVSLEDDVDLEGATMLKADDDFLLTPVDDADDADSGSQVITLDAEEDFESGFGSSDGLEADLGEPLSGGLEAGGLATQGYAAGAYPTESPYSGWNIAALTCCTLFLVFGGMFMYDLARHVWSWNTPYEVNSAMMDSILGMFEKK
ncbi:MAG: helix-turn-helix domain-containing protein [Planctomycetota bacterium]|nr:helix-turn-helix domain-containing protein [Planctomycetota bacterium]